MKIDVVGVLKLSQMSIPEKITKGTYIGQQWGLYGKNFPTTAPNTEQEREKATVRLSDTHAKAQDGGKVSRAEEKAAEANFDALFGAYRDWANQPDVAMGDATRIAQLGLDVSKPEARRADTLSAPVLLPLTGTDEGKLTAACDSLLDAKAYIFFVAYGDEMPADTDYVYATACTRPKAVLTLESGKVAWVRVLAVGTKGPGPLSTAQRRRVL